MVVVVLGAVGFLLFTSSDDKKEDEDEEVGETVTVSGADAASCNKLGYYSNASPASESTCKTLGYTSSGKVDETSCKSFIDTAKAGMNPNPVGYYDQKWCTNTYKTLSTMSQYCINLNSNTALYAANVVSYYSNGSMFKVVPADTTATTMYYGSRTVRPVSSSASALNSFRIDANKYDVTGGPTFAGDITAIGTSAKVSDIFNSKVMSSSSSSAIQNLVTTTIKTTDSLWKKYGTDTPGNTWYSLDTSKLADAIKSAISTTAGNHFNSFCT